MPSQAGMNRRQKNAEIRIRDVLASMATKSGVELTELPSRRNALVQDTQRIEWIADALEQIRAKVWPDPAPKVKKGKSAAAEPKETSPDADANSVDTPEDSTLEPVA